MCDSVSRSQLSDPLRHYPGVLVQVIRQSVSRSQLSDPLRRPLSEAVVSKADAADLASGPHEARLSRPPAKASRDTNR